MTKNVPIIEVYYSYPDYTHTYYFTSVEKRDAEFDRILEAAKKSSKVKSVKTSKYKLTKEYHSIRVEYYDEDAGSDLYDVYTKTEKSMSIDEEQIFKL